MGLQGGLFKGLSGSLARGRFGVLPLLPKDQSINGTVKYFEKLKVEK
jgi:hypothetical protein